jgi:hypothetical protein
MQKAITRGALTLLAASLVLFNARNARAATVWVDYFSLSPATINITAGEVVYWLEADDLFAPFVISGPWGNLLTPGGLQFQAPGTYNYTAASSWGGGGWPGTVIVSPGVPNEPPVVTITSPTNNTVFTAPATFAFAVEASDPNPDDLWDVEFWIDDLMVDDVYDPPYATTVTDLPAGTYTLTAIAWDYSYQTATNSITITVVDSSAMALTVSGVVAGNFEFNATGLTAGKSHVLQTATNLVSPANWVSVSTNVAVGSTASFTNAVVPGSHFFRLLQLP